MAETEQVPRNTDDAETGLKKRARRRLVGATALALLAVIVLPMVMDKEPRPAVDDIQIRIPAQDGGSFTSRILPAKPAATPLPPVEVPAQPAPGANAEGAQPAATSAPVIAAPAAETTTAKPTPPPSTPAEKAMDKPAPKKAAEASRPTAAVEDKEVRWVVQLGAYHDQTNIKALRAKVKELGYASYTEDIETARGTRTRVRAGPFASHEAALKAQQRFKKVGAGGPAGGVVVQK